MRTVRIDFELLILDQKERIILIVWLRHQGGLDLQWPSGKGSLNLVFWTVYSFKARKMHPLMIFFMDLLWLNCSDNKHPSSQRDPLMLSVVKYGTVDCVLHCQERTLSLSLKTPRHFLTMLQKPFYQLLYPQKMPRISHADLLITLCPFNSLSGAIEGVRSNQHFTVRVKYVTYTSTSTVLHSIQALVHKVLSVD